MMCDTVVMNAARNNVEADLFFIGVRAAAFSVIIFLELKYIRPPSGTWLMFSDPNGR